MPVISVDSLPQASAHAAKAGGTGRLSLVASPPCQISVDGASRGTTPLMNLDLSAGVHRVECAFAGGRTKSANIAVVEGGATHYAFNLEE